MTQISIRLDDETSLSLGKAAKNLHIRRSDIIRMALSDFLKKKGISEDNEELSIYDSLKSFIGVTDSNIPDLSTNPKHLLKKIKKAAKR